MTEPYQIPNKSQSVWLTDISQISSASVESLERSLITNDGKGKVLKRAALNELKRRISQSKK
jgi:hypothetical protein